MSDTMVLKLFSECPSIPGVSCEITLERDIGNVVFVLHKIGNGRTSVLMTPQRLQEIGEIMAALGAAWGRDA